MNKRMALALASALALTLWAGQSGVANAEGPIVPVGPGFTINVPKAPINLYGGQDRPTIRTATIVPVGPNFRLSPPRAPFQTTGQDRGRRG